MDSFSPMNYYQLQAITAAQELDYELELAAKQVKQSAEASESEPVTIAGQTITNSLDNFNAILDLIGD
jgi:hypothetical protein